MSEKSLFRKLFINILEIFRTTGNYEMSRESF